MPTGRRTRTLGPSSSWLVIARLARFVPTPLVRLASWLVLRIPALRPAFERVAGRIAAGEGVVQRGPAKGLRLKADVNVAGYRLGTTEPEFQRAFAERIRPGAVVYDLGANVGFYTVLAARLAGPEGRVVAVEPFPATAETVRHNARANGFETVDVVEAAVGEAVGRAWLRTDRHDPVTFRLGEDRTVEGVEVPITTVDALVAAGHPPPDVVKVDVEGAEVAVLRGMAETLAAHTPALLVEVHEVVADFPDVVAASLVPLGYRASVLGGGPMPRGGARAHVLLDPA